MTKIYTYSYQSTIGNLIIGEYAEKICLCDWKYRKMRLQIDKRIQSYLQATYQEEKTPLIQQMIQNLEEYFAGNRQTFDLPLIMAGSAFQQQVWEMLQQIPYGKTMSYKQLAINIGNPEAVRAVAGANGANAIAIMIPCHRILSADGTLGGYAGGIQTKQRLLTLEIKNQQYSLF